ncbi:MULTISPECIES: hypothetical protein [Streptomyces]|uniref:hypothetical protein n=1 Tax=Streptomyces TaxID=1883 RepID=UPI00073DCBE2|nr:hypothetical protein [Streptomyces sp. EAS-AB2608]MYU28895.1 hypothetical protein [Streptomyces sp. SID7810]BCM68295.1 hypothetical protein EASAB2608_03629 [Streptomyces sp. EAS-AB2608]CUW29939.1 hypothetical protein TUE45_04655 [Streptomyces reticuli]
MSPGDEQGYTETGHTRTRLPDPDPYGGAPRRPHRSSSRSLVTVVGVVVLLIAAIAFANRGGEGGGDGAPAKDNEPKSAPTAATGTRPVTTKTGTIPTGYPHTEQGAQSAAANYAVVLWSDGMIDTASRHRIIETVADPSAVSRLQSVFDANYSSDFLKNIGLNPDGSVPKDATFVDRTLPAGTKTTSYGSETATVDVWCNTLFGMAGESSNNPVTSGWSTVTFKLKWNGSDWKVLETSQRTGPTPITGDNPVSGADEIGKAVKEFGGFTYAR